MVSACLGSGQGFGEDRFPDIVLGPPKGAGCCGGSLDVLSLGNGGSIVLAFEGNAIVDGPGADFLVFENAFARGGDAASVFAELATVEVSEDGAAWSAFPCTAERPPYGSCAGWRPVHANPDENDIDPLDPSSAGGGSVRSRRDRRLARPLRADHRPRRLARRLRPRRGGHRPRAVSVRRPAALACAALVAAGVAPRARGQEAVDGDRVGAIEVHVAGQRASTVAARDPTAASYVIHEDDLRAPGAAAPAVLSRVPGLQVSRTGASSDLATASLRGASSAETPVYLAGVRLNDDVTGTADLSMVPLWMIQRVEVYRGNAPEHADRLGIGGAIFFEPALPRAPRASVGLGVGSFGERSAWASVGLGDERAGALIALSRRAADNDYLYTDSRLGRALPRPNADTDAYDVWSIGRYRLPWGGSITAIVNGFARDQGTTGLSETPARAARSHVQRWLGAASAVVPCAGPAEGGVDRCRLELTTSAILSRQVVRDPRGELGLLSPVVASAGARGAEQAALRYRPADDLSVSASAAYERELLALDRAGKAPLRASRATYRASASLLYAPIASLEGYALGALELHRTRHAGAGGPARALEPSGRLGARLRLADGAVSVFGNLGRYVRVPVLGELHGSSPIVVGNPELAPERGLSAELGVRLAAASPRARGELSCELLGFSRFTSGLIAYRPAFVGVLRPYNVGSARVLGLELAASASALDHVRAGLALTALDPRDTSPGRAVANDLIPFQARLVAAPSVEVYAEPARLGVDRASLSARLFYRASRVGDPAGLRPLPEQATADVELAILALRRRLSARVAITNVFAARTFDLLNLELPGRSVHAATEVWW
ncbi:TonB-dependent receptor [Sorangium cellulosum]|uniref:TonB-dependent receptor n=1 Tax=Sorangium cellulosum TaxID=56 RepID=UPI001F2EC0C2|nr:TonB-dependent receptor [Sorangium cellulosum]